MPKQARPSPSGSDAGGTASRRSDAPDAPAASRSSAGRGQADVGGAEADDDVQMLDEPQPQQNSARNVSSSSASSSAPTASATANARLEQMRERAAEVARQRAAFFARGGGAGTGLTEADVARRAAGSSSARQPGTASPADDANAESAANRRGGAEGGAQNRQWHGPFTVGMELLAAREQAARDREEENEQLKSGSKPKRARTSGGNAGSSATGMLGEEEEGGGAWPGAGALGLRLADYTPTWQPRKVIQSFISPLDRLKGLVSETDASPSASPAATASQAGTAGVMATAGPYSTSTSSIAVGSATAASSSPAGVSGAPGSSPGQAPLSVPGGDVPPKRVRMVAVAGPSGVRLGVPSLQYTCLETLIPYVPQLEDLSPLPPQHRQAFATALCRHRALDGHAFSLFAWAAAGRALPAMSAEQARGTEHDGGTGAGQEGAAAVAVDIDGMQKGEEGEGEEGEQGREALVIPDCAGVDEAHMVGSLREGAAGRLHTLTLGHCGRGLSDHSVRALVGGSAHPHPHPHPHPHHLDTRGNVFSTLQHLSLEGAYALSEAGLRLVLTHAGRGQGAVRRGGLRSLRLASNELLDGSFLSELPLLHPYLECLSIQALPKVGDTQLLGLHTSAPAAAAAGGGAAKGGTRALAASAPGTEAEEEAALQAPIAASLWNGKHAQRGRQREAARQDGGILGLHHLHSLHLAHLSAVTDAPLIAWLAARTPGVAGKLMVRAGKAEGSGVVLEAVEAAEEGVGRGGSRPAAPVRSLRLHRLPLVTDATLLSLAAHLQAVRAGSRTSLNGTHSLGAAAGSGGGSGSGTGQGEGEGLGVLHLEYLPKVTSAGVLSVAQGLVGHAADASGTGSAGVGAGSGAQAAAGGSVTAQVSDLSLHGCSKLSAASTLALLVATAHARTGMGSHAASSSAGSSSGSAVGRAGLDSSAHTGAMGLGQATLQTVNLSGLPGLTDACLVALATHHGPTLLDIDVSFCREIGDAGLGQLADSSPRLHSLRLWGNSQVSGAFFGGHRRADPSYSQPWLLSDTQAPQGDGPAAAPGPASHQGLPPSLHVPPTLRPLPPPGAWATLRVYGRDGDVMPQPDA